MLPHFKSTDVRLVIVMDSQYVYDGLKGTKETAFR